MLWEHTRWKYLERRLGSDLQYLDLDMGCFTLDMVKRSCLAGTVPYLSSLGRKFSSHGKRAVRDNPNKKVTSKQYVDSAGNVRSTGGPDLKGTQAYAMGFGCQHALAYRESCHHFTVDKKPGHELNPDTDSDSEIGSTDESCFLDFKYGPSHFANHGAVSSSSSSQ